MARTTRDEIAAIIELDAGIVPDDAAMLPFITIANELVTECCTGTKGPTTAYSGERLALIECWLAAHLYTNRDPRVSNEGAGPVSAGYQGPVAIGFDSSLYGQTAMRLDTNGGLALLNENTKKGRPRVGGYWLGTPATQ